jgi:glucose-1-phosphate thymidylyltransferase
MKRKGIVLAGGSGSRLYPLSSVVSKQLQPIYDKPMIYYPISVLMQASVQDILIISTPKDLPLYRRLLGNGSQFGISLEYEEQASPNGLAEAYKIGADFIGNNSSILILGDNLFYGDSLVSSLKRAFMREAGATIFAYHVTNARAYGIVEFDKTGKVMSIEEKPQKPKSSYAVPGLYFYDAKVVERAKGLTPSKRGELEITDLNRLYLDDEMLHVEKLGRGIAWLDTGTHRDLLAAGNFVETIEERQGLKIGCLEEIGLANGWIKSDKLETQIRNLGDSQYVEYLKAVIKRYREG